MSVHRLAEVCQPEVDNPLRGLRHGEGSLHSSTLRVAAHDDVLHLELQTVTHVSELMVRFGNNQPIYLHSGLISGLLRIEALKLYQSDIQTGHHKICVSGSLLLLLQAIRLGSLYI